MIRKLMDMFNKPYNMVEDDELGLYAWHLILIGLFLSLFILFFLVLIGFGFFNALLIFLGIFIFYTYIAIICYKRDFIDLKFGLYDKFGVFSYKYISIVLLGLYIASAFGVFSIALMKSDIYSALGYGISMLFPIVFTCLNLDMFDSRSKEILVENEFGVKEYVQVLGYFPGLFILLGFIMGAGPLGLAMTRLIRSILFNEYSIIYYFLLSIILLIIEYFMYAPETMNNILPFEVRTAEGLLKYNFLFWFITAIIFLFAF